MQVRLEIQRRPGLGFRRRPQERLVGASGFSVGVVPRAVDPSQFGALEQALPPERHEVWLGVAPPGQRLGPLLGATHVEQLLARRDDRAIDDPGDRRRHLVRRHRDHRLIEERDTPVALAEPDQRLTATKPSKCREVRVGESIGDRGDLLEHGVRAGRIAAIKALETDRQEEVALLDVGSAGLLEHPRRPREPAAGARHLALPEEPEAQPERGAGGQGGPILLDRIVVGPRTDLVAILLSAEEMGDVGEPLEVVESERRFAVGFRQPGKGLAPGPSPEGLPSEIECVGCGHSHEPPRSSPRARACAAYG